MKSIKKNYLGMLAGVLLIGGSIAFTGCDKENGTKDKIVTDLSGAPKVTSTAFEAELLTYNVTEKNGYAWTWKITRDNPNQTQALGHFDLIDGFLYKDYKNYNDKISDHVISAFYSIDGGVNWKNNGINWGKDSYTKDCFESEVLKFDVGGDNLLIKLIMNEQYVTTKQLAVYKTSGKTQCGIIKYTGIGCLMKQEVCWNNESAWSDGRKYASNGIKATYTEYAEGTVTLYTSQAHDAGTVHFSAVSAGTVTITITLKVGFRLVLDENNNIVSEAVKVQGYSSAPSGYPDQSFFTYYKGTSLIFEVDEANFYGVHLDVERKDNCLK